MPAAKPPVEPAAQPIPAAAARPKKTPDAPPGVVLPEPLLGPVGETYDGPVDAQGWPAMGNDYIDNLNWNALFRCESGSSPPDPNAYLADDADSGGERFGIAQFAKSSWHHAVDLGDNESADPYQDPRDAPAWYQAYRSKRFQMKEWIAGQDAWRYPHWTHHMSCGDRLFDE